ncbi:2Fe-2S iron-sulfur cluster binding domain-containing protein [Archangium violaceum]|uniref:(2Fe-2S)-binding protein n=1 Tax=Archangium violaceum TaxID=83451 RepID=UPI00193C3F0A|nr:2Fe-2S iron-sulfur cluster-binding protein [Archangium violaceum]QRK07316.1 2Fe-2S iron-sulfur cluster binding domain-containing protein [Archangium violaceum]
MSDPIINVNLTVNGETYVHKVPASLPLVDFLHEEVGLTGTKFGCGIGVCRACTVATCRTSQAHPVPTLACSTPVSELNGQFITTVEGLAGGREDARSAARAEPRTRGGVVENFRGGSRAGRGGRTSGNGRHLMRRPAAKCGAVSSG